MICLLYPAIQQWNLHNNIEDALKKAEIPKGSIERFGWMFRGGELKYDFPEARPGLKEQSLLLTARRNGRRGST